MVGGENENFQIDSIEGGSILNAYLKVLVRLLNDGASLFVRGIFLRVEVCVKLLTPHTTLSRMWCARGLKGGVQREIAGRRPPSPRRQTASG
jgi:hypothetical protein